MNEIQIFQNGEFGEIDILVENGKEWFPAIECAKILGYVNPYDAITRHCELDGLVKREGVSNTTNQHGITSEQLVEKKYIDEGNLWRLIIKSNLPSAKKFEKWVFEEVLPTIRKHGGYLTAEKTQEILNNPDLMIQMCLALKEEREKAKELGTENKELKQVNAVLKPKAEYFDAIVDSKLLTNFRDTAKKLNIPQGEFIDWVIKKKIIYRDMFTRLKPYASSVNKGWCKIKEQMNQTTGHAYNQTFFTPEGVESIRLLLELEDKGDIS